MTVHSPPAGAAPPQAGAAAPCADLRLVIAGHVDHGKSTLIGRLIYDAGLLPDGKLEAIRAMSERRGMPFEWSFLLDALQAERDQGVTIDTSQIRLRRPAREVLLIDAPGHLEFLRNMVTGAAQADAALLVIDAAEGLREQSRRHGFLLQLIGIRSIAVVVNKMDRIGFSKAGFEAIERESTAYLLSLGLTPHAVIPVAARTGDMVAGRGDAMSWYQGPTVTGMLDRFEAARPAQELPLRFPVQDVYKFDQRRIVAGRIVTGTLAAGDELVFHPSGNTAIVKSIETWPEPPAAPAVNRLGAGCAAAVTLDHEIFLERGEIAAHRQTPPALARVLSARIFWLGAEPLSAGSPLTVRLATAEAKAAISTIDAVIDTGTLERTACPRIERNQVADVTVTLARRIAADTFAASPATGRFVLEQDGRICGGGIVLATLQEARRRSSPNVMAVNSAVSEAERHARAGHRGAVVWLTGLPGSGKTTLGRAIERAMFDRCGSAALLDGDTLRTGLNGDLGFSAADRSENIRRTAEVAMLMARNGQIAIVALVSPAAADRARVREVCGETFHEVWVKAGIETCAARDPKGHYARAKAGQIQGFTGVSAVYEAPEAAEVVLDTETQTVDQCVARLIGYLEAVHVLDMAAPPSRDR